ncbi:MAG TPA: MFS transporter, partial [Candidatus Methylacidiphilales bacterium]|nr:MFS transporter [Candidatus Methylacidiphilales bacterium]
LALLAVGMGSVLVMASCNTLVQNMVDEGMRGRVMAIYSMVFLGGMPLGSLMTGSLATHWGVPAATFFNGVACIVLAALFYRQLPTLRVEARAAMERTGAIAPLTPAPAAAENIAG